MDKAKKTMRVSTHNEQKGQKRLLEARKDFKKMQEEIAPFITVRRLEHVSTAGKWCDTSSMVAEHCRLTNPSKEKRVAKH